MNFSEQVIKIYFNIHLQFDQSFSLYGPQHYCVLLAADVAQKLKSYIEEHKNTKLMYLIDASRFCSAEALTSLSR